MTFYGLAPAAAARGYTNSISNLIHQLTTINVEYVLPDTSFSLYGPTLLGTIIFTASENKVGSSKTTTYRLYRDGNVVFGSTFGSTADDTTGNQHTVTLYVPAQTYGAHTYYVTWALNNTTTSADGLYSLTRTISVKPDLK